MPSSKLCSLDLGWEAQMQSARTGNLGLHSTRFQCTSADSARQSQKLMGSCSALMGQGISCKDFQRICPKSCNELVREPTLPHCWTVVLTFDEARDEPAMRRCAHFSLFSFFFHIFFLFEVWIPLSFLANRKVPSASWPSAEAVGPLVPARTWRAWHSRAPKRTWKNSARRRRGGWMGLEWAYLGPLMGIYISIGM